VARRIDDALRAADESVADPRGAIWGKFIFNSVMNPLARS